MLKGAPAGCAGAPTNDPRRCLFRLPGAPVLAAALAWLLYAIVFLAGAAGVPFHPDESTQLYMSSDLELFFRDPLSMRYDPSLQYDARQHFRLLDAPLTRLSIGVARRLAGGIAALPLDWDWGLRWDENVAAGALPDPALLLAGRIATSSLALLALIFLYQAGKHVEGWLMGALSAGILAINALYLLHARRAMAEGPLLFGVCLAMWGIVDGERRPWLAGLGAALALCAKQSTLALLPVGLLAVVWLVDAPMAGRWRRRLSNLGQFLAVFVLVTGLLNPWLWRKPVAAIQAALDERNHLLAHQAADIARVDPQQVLEGPVKRLAALTVNLFIGELGFAEVGTYHQATSAMEVAYLKNPLHNLLRGKVYGGLFLFLCLAGIALAVAGLRRASPSRQRALILLLLAGGLQLIAIVAAVPLTWQRYTLPLLPFVCLWIAFTLLPRRYTP